MAEEKIKEATVMTYLSLLFIVILLICTALLILKDRKSHSSKTTTPSPLAMKLHRRMHWMTPRVFIKWKIHYFKKSLKRWKLRKRKEEIFAKVFYEIDNHLRPVCIAQLGGFQPSKDLKASWFGNILLQAKDETWPWFNEKPMVPLVQLNLTEAPYVPDKLKDFEMIVLYIDNEFPPMEGCDEKAMEIRMYKSIAELVPLVDRPSFKFCVRPFPIRWEAVTEEGPDYFTGEELADMSNYGVFDDAISTYQKRYHCSEKTKLGGYPAIIQNELGFGNNNYLFQVGSEEKACWMWGDSGIAYFGIDENGRLLFEWQCY